MRLVLALIGSMACAGAAFSAAPGCVPAAPGRVEVQAAPEEVHVAADVPRAEIERLAGRSGAEDRAPAGFYIGSLAYLLTVESDATAACPDAFHVRVLVKLGGRAIHVARELAESPCAYDAAVSHYQDVARADDALFLSYVQRIANAVGEGRRPAGQTPAGQAPAGQAADEARAAARSRAAAAVERALGPYHADRAAALRAVPPFDEAQAVAARCAHSI